MNSFLQKYQTLRQSVPIPALTVSNNEDCQLVDYTHYSKNAHYCFLGYRLENSIYCDGCAGKNLVDCNLTLFSELCYQCYQVTQAYQCTYLFFSHHCRNCHFCALCNNCQDCFGCVNLSHKQYCIFNKQYSKKAYFQKLLNLQKDSADIQLNKLVKLIKDCPFPCSQQEANQNCPYGDFINHSKNVYWSFDSYQAENSGYIYNGGLLKNSWDVSNSGGSEDKGYTQWCYELCGGSTAYQCAFLELCFNCRDCYYCSRLHNCQDCFGCVGLSNKQYCFLNNQLSKKEYEEVVSQVKKDLGWRV